MSIPLSAAAEVFSLEDVARAAGVSTGDAHAALEPARVFSDRGYFRAADAVRLLKTLRHERLPVAERQLFAPPAAAERRTGRGLVASGALHASVLGVIAFLTLSLAPADSLPQRLNPARLVFLATPGPGGGGGGGGLKAPSPPAKAQLKGPRIQKSPVPPPKPLSTRKPVTEVRRPDPPPVRPAPRPEEPPPPAHAPVTPQVVAPVATAAADPHDRAGVLNENQPDTQSQGSGNGGGAGTGNGTGMGEGSGAGIGPGSGGGTGGGPYRPGSGITPPELLHEVKPDYTEEARRLGLSGDVLLEIVVRHDGSVGDVRMIKGLGAGLDRRAVDAVRQWRFAPARRFGNPVDVIVEVAVEFKLR